MPAISELFLHVLAFVAQLRVWNLELDVPRPEDLLAPANGEYHVADDFLQSGLTILVSSTNVWGRDAGRVGAARGVTPQW